MPTTHGDPVDRFEVDLRYGNFIHRESDLFLDDVRRYQSGFFGPGKYDGSVVNWINGPLLRHIGGRNGFDVAIAPFAQRPSSNVKTLTAAVRE